MGNRSLRNVAIGGLMLAFSSGVYAQAMYITPEGDVGIGTEVPTSALELTRDDGTAQIQSVDTSAVNAARQLFRGKNNGPALFALKDTSTSRTWAFTVVPEGFTMSRQGSGVKEFLIFNNGDATLQGTLLELSDKNSKENIIPVNSRNILDKITQLEVSEWSYKDSPENRHIGPMSQDFYKAFGLGGKGGVKGISTLDSSGVALAAIKALAEENASLKQRLELLENQQVEMQAVMVKMLEERQEQPVLTNTAIH